MTNSMTVKDLYKFIRDVPDFPKPGIIFKDITTLLAHPEAFQTAIDAIVNHYKNQPVDLVLGVEARGFIIASAVAYKLGKGLVIVRKPKKLPYKTHKATYELEYGTDSLEIHIDAIKPGQNILLVDDLLATGGTLKATAELVQKIGGKIVGIAFIIELAFLNGRDLLKDFKVEVFSLLSYS